MTKTPNKGASADRMAAMRAARAAKKAAEHGPAEAVVDAVEPAPEPVMEAAVEGAEAAPAPAPVTATTMEKAAITEEAKRHAKIAALRAAKSSNANPVGEPSVTVRVTKKGHGKVSMGDHVNGLGDLTFDHNEEPSFPLSIAQELEERGFVEIQ